MDISSTAASIAGLQRAQTASAIATEVVKASHQQDQVVVGLLEQAVESGKATARAGAPVSGSTGQVDLTV